MKFKIIAVTLLTSIVLTACSGGSVDNGNLSRSETQNIKELVRDYSLGNITSDSASITAQELIVTESDGSKLVYDLSKEDFFVSIAPYVNETHTWTNHSLTGCQGEMVNEEFDVYIEDTDGNVIVNETLTSQSNGFIDLWLPRNNTYRAKIKHGEKVVESEFSTFKNDGTCITTMKLT